MLRIIIGFALIVSALGPAATRTASAAQPATTIVAAGNVYCPKSEIEAKRVLTYNQGWAKKLTATKYKVGGGKKGVGLFMSWKANYGSYDAFGVSQYRGPIRADEATYNCSQAQGKNATPTCRFWGGWWTYPLPKGACKLYKVLTQGQNICDTVPKNWVADWWKGRAYANQRLCADELTLWPKWAAPKL